MPVLRSPSARNIALEVWTRATGSAAPTLAELQIALSLVPTPNHEDAERGLRALYGVLAHEPGLHASMRRGDAWRVAEALGAPFPATLYHTAEDIAAELEEPLAARLWPRLPANDTAGPSTLRESVLEQIAIFVPSDIGDGRFEKLLGEPTAHGWTYYEFGHGTTCGAWMNGLLERAGGPASMLNRGANYEIGAHISKLIAGAQKLGAWRTDLDTIKAGDVYVLASPPQYTDAHVGCFMARGPGQWISTADAGQRNNDNDQAARICKRTLIEGIISYPFGITPGRPYHGHIDLDALPAPTSPSSPSSTSSTSSTTRPSSTSSQIAPFVLLATVAALAALDRGNGQG